MSCPTTIDDLPTELLEEIFKGAVLTLHPHLIDNVGCRRKTLVAISHVSHRWRDVSLDLSSLWAGAVDATASPECIDQFVSRSRTRNLNISMDALVIPANDNDSIEGEEKCQNLKSKFPTFFNSKQWHILRKTQALKRCDELTIALQDQDRAHTWSFEKYVNMYGVRVLSVLSAQGPMTFYLPNLGNSGSCSGFSWKLQRLYLEGCAVDLAYCADSLVNLTVLSVKTLPIEHGYNPLSWLRVLVRLPSLKHLTLMNGFGEKKVKYDSLRDCETSSEVTKFSTYLTRASFQLPQLRSIFVEDDMDGVTDFLRWLDLPEQCGIEISIHNYIPTRVVKVQRILHRFSKRYIRPRSSTRKLSVEMGKSTINMSSVSTRNNSNASFKLWVSWSSGTERFAGWSISAGVLGAILGNGLEKTLQEAASLVDVRMDSFDQQEENKSRVVATIRQFVP